MKFLKNFLGSELGRGSLVLFILINVFNFLNYVFHFSMARLLTPADYGVLGVLMSLVYVYSIPAEAIQGIFTKYTVQFSKDDEKIKSLLKKGIKKSMIYGFFIFIVSCIIGIFISYFLDINIWLIILTNIIIFGILASSILRGVLQGKKRFSDLGWNLVLESLIKLIISVQLALIGLKVFGAVIGVVIGIGFGLVFAILSLTKIVNSKEKPVQITGIRGYSFSFLWAMTVIVLMYSLDILLARRFFSEDLAGKYAVISMLSKMIYFGTFPIAKAMLPISSERFIKGKKTIDLLYKTFLISFGLCSIALILFWLFPNLLIGLLFGTKYLEVSSYLIYVGLALTFLSFSNLIIFYVLSIERLKKYYYLFFFVILEGGLLFLFHDSLLEFSLAFMFSNLIMFLGSLILIKVKI